MGVDVLTRQRLALLLGPLVCLGIILGHPVALTGDQAAALAVTAWIVIWWVGEAIPIPVTALLPIVLFPLTGMLTVSGTTTPYADPIVFLLLGGFLLALSIERWNLHHRLSLHIIALVGTRARNLVLGFMAATAVLSMWISNTATTMMMIPIAAAVIAEMTILGGRRHPPIDAADLAEPNDPSEPTGELIQHLPDEIEDLPNTTFGLALMLGIAFAASIGGSATLIGSPPNAVLAGVARSELGIDVGFLEWMLVGLPLAIVFLTLTWVVLVIALKPRIDRQPEGPNLVDRQLDELGSMSIGERRVLAVFGLVAGGWVLRPFVIEPVLPMVTDTIIAIAGAILVFLVPVDGERLIDWEYATRVPWGVLLLLGAGFSIARAFQTTGLDLVMAQAIVGIGIEGSVLLTMMIATTVVLLTNVTSNTATAALFMPITIGIATSVGAAPLALMATAAFAASFAFMLPVATAPNAIVFGTGYMTIPDMAKIGVLLTLPAIVIITATVVWWLPIVWG